MIVLIDTMYYYEILVLSDSCLVIFQGLIICIVLILIGKYCFRGVEDG